MPNSSALYNACFCNRNQDNPEVIRSILRMNPALASESTYYSGMSRNGLPIHEAIHLPCAAEILPDLIQADPNSLSEQIGVYDQNPLDVAAEKSNLPTDVLRILLENGHRYGVGGSEGQLFSNSEYDEEHPMSNIIAVASFYREDWESGRDLRAWQNFCLALKAAGAFRSCLSTEDMLNYPLLHGAIEFGARKVFFDRIFCASTTEDLKKVDALGRSPLNVAIEMAAKAKCDENYDEDSIHFGSVLKLLLDDQQGGYSRLARISMNCHDDGSNGRRFLPVHNALKLGLSLDDGLEDIVNAYPDALSVPDPESNLIPCLQSAVGAKAKVAVIYQLIMKRPDLIAILCKSPTSGWCEQFPTIPPNC
mmetsp:Transcript_36477/g.53337  ORF Transcript_36477/g.53337 Transcript_36477/m.53337 type:complete len:364 (-) Transcript_36477:1078-2169(-)